MIRLMNALNKLNSIFPSGKPYSVRKFALKIGMHDPIYVGELIRKSQQLPQSNPFIQSLSRHYDDGAENTMWYVGTSCMGLPDPVEVTKVKNICDDTIGLCILDVQGTILAGPVMLAPHEPTNKFNIHESIVNWGVLGPQSGTTLGRYHSVDIEISWKIYGQTDG